MAARAIPPEPAKRLTTSKAWKALRAHSKKVQGEHLQTLFAKDHERGKQLTAEAVDYSKNRINQGAIWNLDSFDQWGVELRKVLAQRITPELESKTETKFEHDSSTNNLIRRYRKLRGTPQ